jgi:hypothetical protein
VWLEDLFQLSNNFDAPIHWRDRVLYSYSCGESADLRKREVWTCEKRQMSLYKSQRIAKEYAGVQSLLFDYLKNRKTCSKGVWDIKSSSVSFLTGVLISP